MNNNNSSNDQAIRDEIILEIGERALVKLMDQLTQALHSGNSGEINQGVERLEGFRNSGLDYRVAAVANQQTRINQLLTQAKNHSNSDSVSSFFQLNNPWLWVSGVALLGLVITLLSIVIRSQQKKKVEE